MLSYIAVAHREHTTGASQLTTLDTLEQLPKLMAGGQLGQLTTAGCIEAARQQAGTA